MLLVNCSLSSPLGLGTMAAGAGDLQRTSTVPWTSALTMKTRPGQGLSVARHGMYAVWWCNGAIENGPKRRVRKERFCNGGIKSRVGRWGVV